jgi:Probable cobalt transporter subunit (CbtB)
VTEIAIRAVKAEAEAPAGLGAPPVPLRDVARWAVFTVALLLALLYLAGLEEGATSIVSSRYLHEFLHDGRHLLAFPCH